MNCLTRAGLILALMASGVLGQSPVPAVPTPPTAPSRLAVISTADTADLASLLTSELSSNPGISLMERDDLAKVGDELKVQQLAGSDAVALGKLINADGLLFIGKGPDGIHARLTAVGLGYSVFDLQFASDMDMNALAKSLSHRVQEFSPKLKLGPGRAIPISVLNLRSDLSSANSTRIERDLTLLLESRLASIPEYVVLERRHAWDLGFEHSLIASSASQLLEGAYVLDGTLKISDANDERISAQLRLRLPKSNQETPLQAEGRLDNLSGMVEAMVAQINQAVGTPTSAAVWQPQAEAREYLREGIWAWEHGQPQASIEALDSAELLGETAPDLLAARIQALCQLAVPELNPAVTQFICDQGALPEIFGHVNPPHDFLPRLPLPDRLALAKRAIADLALYGDPTGLRSYHLQFLDPKWQHEVQLSYSRHFVIHAASCVLTELDQQNDPGTEEFRNQVRQLAGFEPLNGKIPEDRGDGAYFADEWAHSQEEEVAYYRSVLTTSGVENQFNAVFLKSRFIWERGRVFCPRFIKDPVEQQKAFIDFAQGLEQTPEGKLSGLLILSGNQSASVSEAAYAAFLDELGNQRVELVQTGELQAHCLAAFQLQEPFRDLFGAHAVPALRQFLTQSNQNDLRTLQVLWLPSGFPHDEAGAIWKEFKAYKARIVNSDPIAAQQQEAVFGPFETAFINAFPSFAETASHPLSVTHFWQPGLSENPKKLFIITDCQPDSSSVAVLGFFEHFYRACRLYSIHLPDLKTDCFEAPPDTFLHSFKATPQFYYLPSLGRDSQQLYRFDRIQQKWDSRQIPQLNNATTPYSIRDRLFLAINGTADEGSLATYDWDTQNLTVLASCRRRPAQNQFDDRRGYQVLDLFPYFHGTVGVRINFACYTLSDQPGNWRELIPGYTPKVMYSHGFGDKTFLFDGQTGLLVDPAHTQPETLFQRADVLPAPQLAGFGPARWNLSTEIVQSLYGQNCLGMHQDAFFILIRHQTVPISYELIWFDTAHGRDPVHIPLQFAMDSATQSQMTALSAQGYAHQSKPEGMINPTLDPFPLQMVANDTGISLWHPTSGLWFIPYTDIDAYLKSVQK